MLWVMYEQETRKIHSVSGSFAPVLCALCPALCIFFPLSCVECQKTFFRYPVSNVLCFLMFGISLTINLKTYFLAFETAGPLYSAFLDLHLALLFSPHIKFSMLSARPSASVLTRHLRNRYQTNSMSMNSDDSLKKMGWLLQLVLLFEIK